MATLDYVQFPPCATRLRSTDRKSIQPEPEAKVSLPTESMGTTFSPVLPASPTSPTTTSTRYTVLPQILLSTALVSSGNASVLSPTGLGQSAAGADKLLSKKDPLSIPITTVNFRRFVPRVGPVFWLQDRIEEILLWKKGWKVTCTWMAAYAFLCTFPRVVFLVPHAIIIAVMLANSPAAPQPKATPHHILLTHPQPSKPRTREEPVSTSPISPVPEGSKEWLANIQGIQNLMGIGADVHDALAPIFSQLSLQPRTPSSQPAAVSFYVFTFTALTLPPLLLLVVNPYFPIRFLALAGGLTPFVLLHPSILPYLPLMGRASAEIVVWLTETSHSTYISVQPWITAKLSLIGRYIPFAERIAGLFPTLSAQSSSITDYPIRRLRASITRLIDNDRLSDEMWAAEMQEVELFENERWKLDENSAPPLGLEGGALFDSGGAEIGSWSKKHLKEGERCGWTRGRDGWSGVGDAGYVSSNLTFSLASGWSFVETEDWREDIIGEWVGGLIDDEGWTYTNDVWSEPKPYPVYKLASTSGDPSSITVTRRRRWTRRIWYKGEGELKR